MLILMALGSTALVSSNEYFIGEDILAKRYSKLLRSVHPIKVSVITRYDCTKCLSELIQSLTRHFPQERLTNHAKLRVYPCKIPTVITETLIV